MAQTFVKNTESELVAVLVDSSGDPVTSVAFDDVTVEYKKYSSSAFVEKTLADEDWTEVGFGVYTVTFTADELDTSGSFVVVITSDDTVQFTEIAQVDGSPSTSPVTVSTCTISGHVYGSNGDPIENAAVTARLIGTPATSGSPSAIISGDSVTVYTDENGAFEIELIRETLVDISIPVANWRRQLTVPDSAAVDLLDIA